MKIKAGMPRPFLTVDCDFDSEISLSIADQKPLSYPMYDLFLEVILRENGITGCIAETALIVCVVLSVRAFVFKTAFEHDFTRIGIAGIALIRCG